jgi:carboxyl-terminal processing protease
MEQKKTYKYLSIFAAVILAAGLFYTGFRAGALSRMPQTAEAVTQNPDFAFFWDVVNLVREKHVNGADLNDEKVLEGAIHGAIEELDDPYSEYFNPVEAKKFNEDLSGVFGGIGAEIGIRDDQLTVIAPLKGNPAEKAGLKASDKVIEIDATSTRGMDIDMAIKLIRGAPGTTVKLKIMRDGFKEPKEFTVTRAIVNVPTLDWEMKPGGIAYFKLYNFNANLLPAWNVAAAQALLKSPKGIVVDVRNNPGGFLDVSTAITGWFAKLGEVVVREKLRGGDEERIYANGNEAFSRIPVVVLVNEGSASASEILAGALKDLRGAKVIGIKSFGKGSVQEVETLSTGAMLKVSIAEWLTPNGSSINKKGISPDYEVKLTEDDVKKNKDPQLQKALEVLNGLLKKK